MALGKRDCPKCSFPLAPGERVCRRCKFMPEEGRYIRLEPLPLPHAPAAPEFMNWRSRFRSRWQRSGGIQGRWLYVAAVVPGLAHLICREWRGGLYLVGVIGLLAFGLWMLPGTASQLSLGLAAGLHAYSIFTLTPFSQSKSLTVRLPVLVLLSAALSYLLYYPLIARYVPSEGLMYTYSQDGYLGTRLNSNTVSIVICGILLSGVIFTVIVLVRWVRSMLR